MRAVYRADSLVPRKKQNTHTQKRAREGRSCNRKHFVDRGLFWITSVALLPRQRLLETTRLPSRVQLCFCSNQGYREGCGFTWVSLKQSLSLSCMFSEEPLGSCSSTLAAFSRWRRRPTSGTSGVAVRTERLHQCQRKERKQGVYAYVHAHTVCMYKRYI